MKIDTKGSLEPGKDADIVVFDKDITIDTTIVNGKVVYQRNNSAMQV
jgi:N-acetylglucosamine-6-phosphate deacetylase